MIGEVVCWIYKTRPFVSNRIASHRNNSFFSSLLQIFYFIFIFIRFAIKIEMNVKFSKLFCYLKECRKCWNTIKHSLVNGFNELNNIVRTIDKKACCHTVPVVWCCVHLQLDELDYYFFFFPSVKHSGITEFYFWTKFFINTWRKSPATILKPPFGFAFVGLTSGNVTGITWSLRDKLLTNWWIHGYIVYWFSTMHLFNTKFDATNINNENSFPSQ